MGGLKIAFLVDMSAPFFGGGYQDRYWNLARHLVRRGHAVTVYTSLDTAEEVREGVRFSRAAPTTYLPDRTGSRTLAHSALFSAAVARPPAGWEVPEVLVTEAIPYVQLPALGRWVRGAGCARVLNVNEAWTHYSYLEGSLAGPSRGTVRACLRSALRWNDRAIAISTVTAQALRTGYGATKVDVVPMGIDPAPFRASLEEAPPAGPYDVVTVGRLVPMKRQGDLLRALSVMRQEHGWTGRAAIVGDGVQRAELARERSALGLEDRVDLLGQVEERRKLGVLRGAKLFALCSEREGFSLATLEAMLAGVVPVVAVPRWPEVFGVADLVEEGETGARYPLGDVRALAHGLQDLLDHPDQRQRLAQRARDRASRYDWSAIASDLESKLRGLVQGR